MRKNLRFLFAMLSLPSLVGAQSFSTNTSLLSSTFTSGGVTGVTDMNNDGLDDIVILDQSKDLHIAYQQHDGSFTIENFGTVSNESQWGMCIGDIDNDGHTDVMVGGSYDDVHFVNINGPGNYQQTDYPWASIFLQGCNLADINEDGYLDGFGCHDDGHNALFINDGSGNMTNGVGLIDMVFYPEVNGGNDNSGNYGSVWTDFDRDGDTDLFIAKCRQFINDPYDARRTNILVINNGDGTYSHTNPSTGISYAQERGLVNLQQSWTSDFADLDNDGDFDCFLTTHSGTLEIHANDGNGFFTNVTSGSGLEYSGFFLQGKFHDFDNDGYLDLIHSGGNHDYYHNNGNMTFTLINNMFVNNDVMHSFGIGDLNHDGWLDLYASYGDGYVDWDTQHPDKIFMNDGGENHFIVFDLEGTVSPKDAAGAIVEITGPWGTQLREVRDGESYGITNTAMCHFGLGSSTEITQAKIYWPMGSITTIDNPVADSWYNVVENGCILASPQITAMGGTVFCPGGSVELTTSASGSYEWNTGETSPSIVVNTPGSYNVSISDGNGCSVISQSITVAYENLEPASILYTGSLQICETQPITLTATEGASYLWNTGETSQAIQVSETGTYSVEVIGICGAQTSEPVDVVAETAPASPEVTDINLIGANGDQFTFNATGSGTILWYDAIDATTPIATGTSFTTNPITSNSNFYVSNANIVPGEEAVGGKDAWTENGNGQYQTNSNYYLTFDVNADMNLVSVDVYAQGTANRTIAVIDAAGNTVASTTVSIPDGLSTVALGFDVPEGTGYSLRLVGNNPLIWRDKDLTNGFAFPFNIGTLATITGTNVNGADFDNYYYYFYNWVVEAPDKICESPRIEVAALVGMNESIDRNINIYPNPVSDYLTIQIPSDIANGNIIVRDQLGKIVFSSTNQKGTWMNIDCRQFASGIYMIEIFDHKLRHTEKFIVK